MNNNAWPRTNDWNYAIINIQNPNKLLKQNVQAKINCFYKMKSSQIHFSKWPSSYLRQGKLTRYNPLGILELEITRIKAHENWYCNALYYYHH